MTQNRVRQYLDEAMHCRLQALSYLGTAEEGFLLSVARAFEEIAEEQLQDGPETSLKSAVGPGCAHD